LVARTRFELVISALRGQIKHLSTCPYLRVSVCSCPCLSVFVGAFGAHWCASLLHSPLTQLCDVSQMATFC